MKIIAWNINGIRSLMKEDYLEKLIEKEKPDIICFGETKLSCKCIEAIPCKCKVVDTKTKVNCECPFTELEEELREKIKGYKYRYWHHSRGKLGYSGTAIFSKKEPNKIVFGLKSGDKDYDEEGRLITLEYDKLILVHVYTPNSGEELKRLDYRTKEWDVKFRDYIKHLHKENKPVIICGDLNVARGEIDLKNPKTNTKTAGFTKEERESFEKLLEENKLIDTYRYLNPEKIEYSYWSYRFNSRAKNAGWRIDYFLINEKYIKKVKNSEILTEYYGSDHAPIKLNIKI